MSQLEIGLFRTPFHSLSAELQPFYEHLRIATCTSGLPLQLCGFKSSGFVAFWVFHISRASDLHFLLDLAIESQQCYCLGCWNCRDFLMIWVPLKCFAILWLSASPCGGWNAWIVATCSRTFSCYNDFEKKVRCINSGVKSKVALRSSIHPFQIWW